MTGLPIARVFGIEVRVHLSWVLILAVVTLAVGDWTASLHPGWPPALAWTIGGIAAVLLFGSVLAHELAHSLAARRRGLPQTAVTLLFFGGMSSLEQESGRPGDEAAIAGAGPLASLLLAAVFLSVGPLASDAGPVGEVVGQLAVITGVLNLLLGIVNLVPAFPLDGGRLLRAAIWRYTRDERRANRVAATAGRVLGLGLVAAGVWIALAGDTWNGIMLGASGWLLSNASRAMDRRALAEEVLAGIRVDEVMERDLPAISPQLTLDTFAAQFLSGGQLQALPVMRDDAFVGMIGASQLKRVGRRSWPTTRVMDLMVAPPDLPTLAATEPLWPAVERLRLSALDGLPVLDGAAFLGILTRRAVVGAIQARVAQRGGDRRGASR